MSSTTATRHPRFAPPAPPTHKAVPRRRLAGHGASVLGRAGDQGRPVLRIVADDERAPVVTRIRPPVGGPVELVETAGRRIDLEEFFASEYDGDDQRVELARPRPSSVRLTRRGRLVVLGAGLAAALGLGLLGATQALAGDTPATTRVVTVRPGQTLWDISAAAADSGDVRAMVSRLEALNHLDSTTLQVGQHLRVPD
jgi:LysM domain